MDERKWKLGDDCIASDAILDPITFDDLILAVRCNCQQITPDAILREAKEFLEIRLEDFWFLVKNNIQEIIDAATPEEQKPLRNAPGWDSKRLEDLAWEIQKWLLAHDMWQDVYIYYDGKRMGTSGMVDGKEVFRYGGDPFIEDGFDPRRVSEYVAKQHILTMVFEGPLYGVLNAYTPGWTKLEAEFQSIFARHGCYYEMGEAFNLTVYEG